MKLGIVGHEAAKFTPDTEVKARQAIRQLIEDWKPKLIVSGGCHLGGIDIWAEEAALVFDIPTLIHKPKVLSWEQGYKPRNLAIARDSDLVACIVVKELPTGYKGMRFKGCYHCGDRVPPHVKSGGCWTAKKCKLSTWVIIG